MNLTQYEYGGMFKRWLLNEPYLLYLGFISITPNGRVATEQAKEYLKNKDNKEE